MNRKKDVLLRSMLFLPATNERFVEKALESDADAIILDVEDSVPPANRQEAREKLKQYFAKDLFKEKTVFIRINEIGSEDFIEDIKCFAFEGLTGFMPSKIRSAGDIIFLDKLLSLIEQSKKIPQGTYALAPLIETAEAVNNVEEIAFSSDRLLALCLGGEDYLNDLHSTYVHMYDAIFFPRVKIVNAARAAGILPIDTPYLELKDFEGYETEERRMYQMGFAGDLLVNPSQIVYANRCFSPSEEELSFSQNIMEAAKNAKEEKATGIAVYDGKMIGPPMIKRAETVLKLRKLIDEKENNGN